MGMVRVDDKYKKYRRIPFEEGGRSMEGADCYGLVKLILEQEHGVTGLPNYGPGLSQKDDQDIIKSVFEEAIASESWEKLDEPEIGCVVWFNVMGEYHVGILVGEGCMMHSMEGINTCLEDVRGLRWERRILGYYKWTGK